MTSRRVFGIIFILLASILTLAVVGRLPALFGVIFEIFKIFTGKLAAYQIGETIGHVIYWIIHFVGTIALWKYGISWSKKKVEI